MSFGERLRALRMEHNLYQKDLAKYLKVSVSTISNYETSTHLPDAYIICRLADYFQVSSDYLLERTDIRDTCDILSMPLTETDTVSDYVELLMALDVEKCKDAKKYLDYLTFCSKKTAAIDLKQQIKKAMRKKNGTDFKPPL